jgi:2,4-dienoyl-CoA reductase-like NADH-dependent reductase (Old Yellow Enzyme family)
MTRSPLFDPLTLRGVTLRNRIGMTPMCQYAAEDGVANDWHLVHLGGRAVGGAGLVIVEDTAVLPDGRITPGDLGLWSDRQVEPLRRITRFLSENGAVSALQLGHAGRKASTTVPWRGGRPQGEGRSLTVAEGAWPTAAPSPIPFGGDRLHVPAELTPEGIRHVQQAFGEAAARADAAGFDMVELHGAWGYLFQQFYSPLSNRRTDDYGGSFENRIRFTVETVREVRSRWPESKPLAFRMAATDWIEGGWTPDDAVELSQRLKTEGVDLIDVISFGNAPQGDVPWGAGFQVPFSERIRREAGVATTAVGFITTPVQAEEIVAGEQADVILVGRQLLRDPHWPTHAAETLGDGRLLLPSNYEHWLSGRGTPAPIDAAA